MNGLDKFDNRTCGILNKAIIEALTDLSKKFNLEFATESGRYDDLQYTVRLRATLINEQGESGDKLTWDKYAALYGLEKEDFGKVFNTGTAKTFKIVGVSPRRTKRPIVGEDIITKKRFVFEPHTISFHLRKQEAL